MQIDAIQLKFLAVLQEELQASAWEVWKRQDDYWERRAARHDADRHRGGIAAVLGEMRAANKSGWDVYFRPAMSTTDKVPESSCVRYPYVFLDDVPLDRAKAIASRHRALVCRTSIEGGCQIILFTQQNLTWRERTDLNRVLMQRVGADDGSISGEKRMRLPGFTNHKRGGQWVNVVAWPKGERLDVARIRESVPVPVAVKAVKVETPKSAPKSASQPVRQSGPVGVSMIAQPQLREFSSQSDRDFHDVAQLIRDGQDDETIIARLAARSTRKGRNGRYAAGYAARTVAAVHRIFRI